jgi:predicted permease
MTPFNRLWWRPRVEDEVDDELAFHLEMRTRELIAQGMAPALARREAERRFGDLAAMRDTLRALGGGRNRRMATTQYLNELRQDVRHAARQFRRNPGFALVAALTLALGIGGTTSIFSILDAVVLQPIPLREPNRLLVIGEAFQGALGGMSVGNYVDAAAATPGLEAMAAANFVSQNLSDGVTPERIIAGKVTANFFDVLGVRAAIGRTFTADEDQPGSDRVVVLSHHLWTRQFGGDGAIAGRSIRMNGATYVVAGVMPASIDLVSNGEDLWMPIAFTPAQRVLHDEHYLTVYGRLKPGVTRERVDAELESVAARLRRDFPKDDRTLAYQTVWFRDEFIGGYRTRILVLLGAVGLVLLIACGNVANLLLARGTARAREIAVRSALGAGRWRIVRQLLTESVVLAMAAAAAGIVLGAWSTRALVAWAPTGVPRLSEAHLDLSALGFAVLVALASSVVCGLAPALRLARADVQSALRDGGRGATGGGLRDRLRAVLIVAEVALSLLLLVGAGLLIRSAIALQHVHPGFDANGVLTARFTLPETNYADPAKESEALRRINDAASQLAGVHASAVTSYVAMGGGGGTNGLIPEGKPADGTFYILAVLRLTTPGFFAAMGTPILRGRGFTDDDRAAGQRVMIVSADFAARAFPGQDAVGKRVFCCEGRDTGFGWKIVVGVAGDIRSRGPAVEPRPEFYLPMAQAPNDAWHWFRTFYVVVRTDRDPLSLVGPLRAAVARIDPDLPIFDVRTMDQRLAGTLATERFNTLLLSLLGAVGLALAAIGIYGVIAYFVTQRTQEIGVRMALGATTSGVVRLVLAQALRPVAAGAVIGVAGALAATHVLASQLVGVSRTDPLTIAAVVATLFGVALVASAAPARRAAITDPSRALRAE